MNGLAVCTSHRLDADVDMQDALPSACDTQHAQHTVADKIHGDGEAGNQQTGGANMMAPPHPPEVVHMPTEASLGQGIQLTPTAAVSGDSKTANELNVAQAGTCLV